jgi:archaellum biogenesis ATPase FlaH
MINYRLTTLNDVFEYPEPAFIVDQILIEKTLNIVGGYTGIGKSIIALSIIKSVLTGEDLWGKYPVLKTGPVLLVDEETPNSFLSERVKKMGFSKDLPFYFLHFQNVRLDRDDYFNALLEKIQEVNPVLVVIDSLIRVHRQKDDEATSMALIVDRLRKIANSGTTVLVIHHHRKAEGPLSQKLRGSSDIAGGVDVEYAITEKDGFLVFQSVKTRTKPLNPIKLKMDITDENIEVIYRGVEIMEREEVLNEVIAILKEKGKTGVMEIHEALKERGVEIGINALRDILRNAVGEELIEHTGEKGKKLYEVNPSFTLHGPIYTRETVKQKTRPISKVTDDSFSEDASEAQTFDSQEPEGSFTASQRLFCEAGKQDNSLKDSASQLNGIYKGSETVKQEVEEDPQFLIDETIQRVEKICPFPVMDWAKRHSRYKWMDMRRMEDKINQYVIGKKMENLKFALSEYEKIASQIRENYNRGY